MTNKWESPIILRILTNKEQDKMAYVSQEDKAKLAPVIKSVLKKYSMKGSIKVQNHTKLAVTIKSGKIDFKNYTHGVGYIQVNEFHVDRHYQGEARNFLSELVDAMKGPDYFDNSDAMTDYFHTSHYISINIGKYDTPYQLTA